MNSCPFAGKMLVTDMDGTLLDSKSRISEKNRKAIERFVAGGGLFTVATGRMFRAVEPYLPELPLNLPAIVFNGAAIYDFKTRRILWQDCLPSYMEDVCRRILDRFPGLGFEVFHGSDIYIPVQNEETEKHAKREGFKAIFTELNNVPKPWFKVLVAARPEELLEVEEFLKGMREEFHAVYSEPQFLELLNAGASKGSALKHLARILNIPCQNIIAMGDNQNDIEMLKEAGIGIAVANAHSDTAAAADLICCHHDMDAVAEVISWIEDGTIAARVAV